MGAGKKANSKGKSPTYKKAQKLARSTGKLSSGNAYISRNMNRGGKKGSAAGSSGKSSSKEGSPSSGY